MKTKRKANSIQSHQKLAEAKASMAFALLERSGGIIQKMTDLERSAYLHLVSMSIEHWHKSMLPGQQNFVLVR